MRSRMSAASPRERISSQRGVVRRHCIQYIALNSKDLACIVFNPAALRKVLREGHLVGCDGCEVFVEGDGAAARRPGIHCDEDGWCLSVHVWSVSIQDSVV